MKNLISKLVYAFLLIQLFTVAAFGQVKYTIKDNATLQINGTSSLHDWSMKSSKGTGDVVFTFNSAGHITGLSSVFFMTSCTELKSDHSGLDKNAYKSLKSDKNPYITFTATNGTVTSSDGVNYTVKCVGKLVIAGVSKDAELISSCKLNADKSITISGTKKMNMTEWGVVPPSFMFGAMKTGKDITLKFDVTLKK